MPEGEGSAALAAGRAGQWFDAATSRRALIVGSAAGVAAGWLLANSRPVDAAAMPHTVFAGLVGDRFEVTPLDGGVAAQLELIQVTASQPIVTWLDGRRVTLRDSASFSLTFSGPVGPVLSQATYRFDHPSLGAFALFIVPAAPTETAPRYVAVFNRLGA